MKKVALVNFKLVGNKEDFNMTVKEIEEYIRLQIEDEESPFKIVGIHIEIENKR